LKLGIIAPQGWVGEYNGWDPQRAWARTVAVSQQAEAIGAESVWLFDHFHTVPRPTDEITFESFTSLSALAALTRRVRLGQIVICNGFRNPALTAKMASTLDSISGGRFELGIGAGWKRDEWNAYGYGFPETKERLAMLHDALEVIGRMLEPGRETRATYEGDHHSVRDAINQPKPVQESGMPIMVGGNGPNVTWRLAARYADELNLDGLSPDEVEEALPTIRARCEEIGRDPDSLSVSVHLWWQMPDWLEAGSARQGLLADYAELGVSRVIGLVRASADSDEALEELAADARAAGVELARTIGPFGGVDAPG
jgi:F420-dependent oxidoreductase-like protein